MSEPTRGRRARRASGPRGGPQVRLADVARLVGVSTATVSRALNRPEAVSEDVRARVAEAVRHLGWVPHGAARALITRRSGTVGAIIPNIAQENFAEAIQALQQELLDNGHTLLLACSEYDPASELQFARKMIERGVDALALVGEAHMPELYHLLAVQGVPFVNTFNYRGETTYPSIGVDNYRAMLRLTGRLLDLGHARFGVIAQHTRANDRAGARLAAIVDALAMHGLTVSGGHMATGAWSVAEGRALFRGVVSASPRPTAVLCTNGYLAVGAVLEAAALGLRVPADVSIAGFDDLQIMAELPVPVTTVRVPSAEIGRLTARYLLSRMQEASFDGPFECAPEILLRDSIGPPPGDPDDGPADGAARRRRAR